MKIFACFQQKRFISSRSLHFLFVQIKLGEFSNWLKMEVIDEYAVEREALKQILLKKQAVSLDKKINKSIKFNLSF